MSLISRTKGILRNQFFPDPILVPVKSKGRFLEVWGALRRVPRLYTVIGISESGTGGKVKGENLTSLDCSFRSFANGKTRASSVYTDRRVFLPHTLYAEIPTARALRYIYTSPRVNAVAFNLSDNQNASHFQELGTTHQITYSEVIPTAILPRLIGLVESSNPFAEGAMTHGQLASQALSADNVYVAHFHAQIAREQSEEVSGFIFPLLDTLLTLGFVQEAADYIQWYSRNGYEDPQIHLYAARIYSLSGKPETSFEIVDAYFDHPTLSSVAWLEHGRALIVQDKFDEAVRSFKKAVALNPNGIDSLLGCGLAIRNKCYPDDVEGLFEAKTFFERVVALNGYHTNEALFHLGTIAIAQEEWVEAEALCKRTLAISDNAIARRNLILSLHAQQKMDEAELEFGKLRFSWPEEAERIEHYFR